VRPGGAGSPRVVVPIRGACRCFACGGDLDPPFSRSAASAHDRWAHVPFVPVDVRDVRVGDSVLVAATLERVIVHRVLGSSTASGCGQVADADEEQIPEELGDTGSPVLVCRFPSEDQAADVAPEPPPDEDEDGIAYRPEDLVWPSLPPRGASVVNSDGESFRQHGGFLRSRRELVLVLGSAAAARQEWGAESVQEHAPVFASCVRGHFLHARCFQGCLVAGSGCPACSEPLFVPGVQRERTAGDDAACCGSGSAAPHEEAIQTVEEGAGAPSMNDVQLEGQQLRMCPLCCAGPLLNEHCSDLQAHHGQCPRCGQRPFSSASIAEAVARAGSSRIGTLIPQCPSCKVSVLFNGCAECGHLFNGTSWDGLPLWDPRAKAELEMNERYLRSVRLLAAQVRSQAAFLAHEQAALEEACAVSDKQPVLDFGDRPPPPRLSTNAG